MQNLLKYITLLLLIIPLNLFSQDTKQLEKQARKAYTQHNYAEALQYIEPLVDLYPNNESYIYSLAVCYIKTNSPKKGIDLLDSIEKSSAAQSADFHYYIAEGYLALGKIHLAEDAIYQASLFSKGVENVEILKQQIENAKVILSDKTKVIVRHLGPKVNSKSNEHSITLTKDHQSFLFTRVTKLGDEKSSIGSRFEQIYHAYMDANDEWATPARVAELSADGHAATIQLFDNDTKALLYRDGNIYEREKAGEHWGSEYVLKGVNSPAQETHAFITEDQQHLYFASRGFNDTDDLDLFHSTWNKRKKQWNDPVELTELNTPENEDSPFINAEGELFFSSKGHHSMGGYDIFRSVYDEAAQKWTAPQNLGVPINSTADDTYFSMYGKIGYFSSARTESLGQLDIYQVFFFDKVRINGVVLKENGDPLVNASVRLESKDQLYETITNEKGAYSLLADIENNFYIKVEKNSNIFHEGTYSIKIGMRNNKEEEQHFYVIRENSQEDGVVLASAAPNVIPVKIHNTFNVNPMLGANQGIEMTIKKTKKLHMTGKVSYRGLPIENAEITVNNKPFKSDKKGEFIYHLDKTSGLFSTPRVVTVAKEDMELKSWYIEGDRIIILLRDKLQDVLEGRVVDENDRPIVNKVLHIFVKNRLFSTSTDFNGEFSITFPIGVRLKTNFEVMVPGRSLKSFAQERREYSQYIKMKVSNEQAVSNIGFRVVDQDGNFVNDALILADGKFASTNSRGYTNLEVDMTPSEFEGSISLVHIHAHDIINRFYDVIQKTLTITVNIEEEEEVVENIEVAMLGTDATEKTIEQRREELSLRNDFLSVYEKAENKELIAQHEIDSLNAELSRLESKLTSKTDTIFSSQDSSLLAMIGVLRNKLQEKEDRMSKFKEENQISEAEHQKEILTYFMAMCGLFLLIIGLIVIVRRAYLQKRKVELVKEELDDAMTQVNDQNIKITNSLRAAQTIQYAILPPLDLLQSKFKNIFSIYRPKDIVSGDFYWYGETKKRDGSTVKFFAVVDCTGHGVPGALMSMIGKTILQEVVDKKLTQDTSIILEMLNQRVITYLRQQENTINDGMDIALCKFETIDGVEKLFFSGAKSDIYIARKKYGVLERHRGSKKSIGGKQKVGREFHTEQIEYEEGDYLIMLTDGILDQNNEQNDKFGRRYFEQYIKKHIDQPIEDLGDLVEAALDVHQNNIPQRDDITVLGIQL
ncbi:SpoIIE family protein phosphatase [Flammeovirga aprica]|uniref:SpoIIE family protein phosphatase n=1 Tax=Flammeovirga aprica JL-4 TaxID=694437 RepID=A0A7X9XCB5_9BACT|nr:SpoIIE family protein phosphatase [Flammeovirga aprica]NME71637.1 SpoIIE family protein phosphatase [Flammeovirga aprica JL-4]